MILNLISYFKGLLRGKTFDFRELVSQTLSLELPSAALADIRPTSNTDPFVWLYSPNTPQIAYSNFGSLLSPTFTSGTLLGRITADRGFTFP